MTLRIDHESTAVEEIDRFDAGVGWIAHPEEVLQRASHAIERDGSLWLIDPLDGRGVEELFADFAEVAGVVVLMDRHTRDAEAIASRHEVPIYLPDFFDRIDSQLQGDVRRFGKRLAETGFDTHALASHRFWREAALYDPTDGTLVVPESLGTAPHFIAGDEPLGVHPLRRFFPPRQLLDLEPPPQRILVGHGQGVCSDANEALIDAIEHARHRLPRAYLSGLRSLV